MTFLETGGPDGRDIGCHLPAESSTEADATTLERLFRDADIFGNHMIPHIVPAGAVWYELHLQVGDRVADWRLNEAQVWPDLRPLIDYLHGLAK